MLKTIESVKGIGPKKAALLHELGIYTLQDMLTHYPTGYEDRSTVTEIGSLQEGVSVLVCGLAVRVLKTFAYQRRGKMLRLKVEDETGTLEIIYFQAKYFENYFREGERYYFYGRVTRGRTGLQMVHPSAEQMTPAYEKGIFPIYHTIQGITQKDLRKLAKAALAEDYELEETLPAWVLEKNNICSRTYAMYNIHFPQDKQKFAAAKYRIIYEELFFLQTGLFLKGNNRCRDTIGIAFPHDHTAEEFLETLSFSLTGAQERVLREIILDMESPVPMQRLVQGDVGSGKTVIAAAALYKAAKNGWQGALMAPTELLARQHLETFQAFFRDTDITVGFLSSGLKASEKKETLTKIADGSVKIVIGTHAVLQETVQFAKLGLVITDEQHRFGVAQRIRLAAKGQNPDTMVMTATPIPRTLAVILFGDMDISIIDELPEGRIPIKTKAVTPKARKKAYDFAAEKIREGQQVYAVAPLVADSEHIEAVSAESLYEELQENYPKLRIGMVHGVMKQEEKDRVMADFAEKQLDILVATVVIEVGINVPDATVMVIENAERFGLAQLHQLRGRVGRGKKQSYCFLITDPKAPLGKERTKIIEETTDGFLIAEKDMHLRGPGDFFGTRQHGLPTLGMADLVRHMGILNRLRPDVIEMLQADPQLKKAENQPVAKAVEKMFGAVDNLGI